jgi:hypothetical protein
MNSTSCSHGTEQTYAQGPTPTSRTLYLGRFSTLIEIQSFLNASLDL